MAGDVTTHARELDQTPTWAVSAICSVIIIISIILEKVLHKIGEVFERKRKKALYEALQKVKGELMVLGFISLLLTFGQHYIANICIPEEISKTMWFCGNEGLNDHGEEGNSPGHGHSAQAEIYSGHGEDPSAHGEDPSAHGEDPSAHGEDHSEHHRRLLSQARRILSSHAVVACKHGHVPLISLNALHQLHIFIFFLAVFHVIYSAITMMLGRAKTRGWKQWEMEAMNEEDSMNDPTRFRLTHETSFVKDHTHPWMKSTFSFYTVCFFRQFIRSVRKPDYLTMRHGFISVHLAPGTKFDFQKYIKRSMEDDFKVVVGISPLLWAFVMIFLLSDVSGWPFTALITTIPPVVVLATGTKLQAIISQMAIEIQERHAVIQGMPLVQVSDRHFWFSRPRLLLHIIHFVLFQNAFEITYFFWIWYEFGLRSCFHHDFNLVIVRVALGVVVQFVCSYITLPLYALVTQMGSTMKQSVFDDQTSKALKQWRIQAKKKNETKDGSVKTSLSPGESVVVSPKGNNPRLRVKAAEPEADTGQSESNMTTIDLSGDQDQRDNPYAPRDLLTGP